MRDIVVCRVIALWTSVKTCVCVCACVCDTGVWGRAGGQNGVTWRSSHVSQRVWNKNEETNDCRGVPCPCVNILPLRPRSLYLEWAEVQVQVQVQVLNLHTHPCWSPPIQITQHDSRLCLYINFEDHSTVKSSDVTGWCAVPYDHIMASFVTKRDLHRQQTITRRQDVSES
jgi:hypothetical protein